MPIQASLFLLLALLLPRNRTTIEKCVDYPEELEKDVTVVTALCRAGEGQRKLSSDTTGEK